MRKIYTYIILIVFVLGSCFSSCVSDPKMPDNVIGALVPDVETGKPLVLNSFSVSVTGFLLGENGSKASEMGFVWYEVNKPETTRDSTSVSPADFSLIIDDLNYSTDYIIQAYVENSVGIGYGEPQRFTTSIPVFNTVAIFDGSVRTEGSASYFVMKKKAYIIGGNKGNENINETWEYTPDKGWMEMLPFSINEDPIRLAWMSGASTNDAILLYGGKNLQGKYTTNLYAYQSSNSWVKLTYTGESPGPIISSAGCYVGGEIYFLGGKKMDPETGVESITDEIWTLNPLTVPLQWKKKEIELPEKQYDGIAFYIDNSLYVGLGKNSPVSTTSSSNRLWSIHLLYPDKWWWTQEMDLPTEAVAKAGVVYDKSIFIVDSEGYIWEFSTIEKEWYRKSMLPVKNQEIHCMFTLEDQSAGKELIYLGFGSEDKREFICYDPTQDTF